MNKFIKVMVSSAMAAAMAMPAVFAADLDGYEINDAAKTMTLHGTISGAKELDDITIQLLKPGAEFDPSAAYDSKKIKSDFLVFTQVLAGSDGGYSLTVDMTGMPAGFCTLRINGKETDKKIYYATTKEKDGLVTDISAAAAKDKTTAIAELTKLLDSKNPLSAALGILNLSEPAIFSSDPAGLAEALYEGLQTETSITPETLTACINMAAYAQALREGTLDITAYEEKLGLDTAYTEAYDRLSDSAKSSFVSKVFAGKNNLTQSAISEAYNKGVLDTMVGSFETWAEIEWYINNFGEQNGVNVTAFNNLSNTNKNTLYTAVLNGSFADTAAFASYVNTQTTSLSNGQTVTPPIITGGGGGSRGGGGTIGGTAQSQPVKTQQDPEDVVSFSDLAGYDWAKESIESLAQKGIVNGVGDNMFEPERNISREEILAMLLRAYDIVPDVTAGVPFGDVDVTQWYAGYIASAVREGVTNGISDTEFGVGTEITREDAAVLSYRLAAAKGRTFNNTVGERFADDASIADYAADAIYAMKNSGIINGKENNEFCPKELCTRAETAKIIYALIK